MPRYELALLCEEGEPLLFSIRPEGSFIGRSDKMDITIPGNTVSRRHVRLWEEGDALRVEDLSSRNGIIVNGERVRSAKLKVGDQIAVGQNYFLLRDADAPRPAKWPKPITVPKRATEDGGATEESTVKASDLTWSSEESEWFRYILDPSKLQRKIAAAALGAASASRAYVLAGGSGSQLYRVLAAETATRNPDGPPINEVIVDRVLRGNKAIAVEGGTGAGESGAACVPLVGNDRCVGVLYADGGLGSYAASEETLDRFARFGRMAGRLLQTAANLKMLLGEVQNAGMRALASAAARDLAEAQKQGAAALDALQTNLASIGRGTADSEILPLDVNLVVERVTEGYKDVAFERNGRAIAYADDRDIADALATLVGAGADRGASVSIRTENKIDGCYVVVSGLDDVIGEDARMSLRTGRDILAHGIGLAAVRAAMERCKGSIRVDPHGRSVTLVFPQREG